MKAPKLVGKLLIVAILFLFLISPLSGQNQRSGRSESFAGTWRGMVNVSTGVTLEWILVVSNDEKHVTEIGNGLTLTYRCYRDGNVLRILGTDQIGDKASGTLRLAGENNVASFDQVLTAQFIWTERMTYAGKMRRDGGGRSNDAANVSRAAPATTSRGGRAATDIAGSYNNGDFIVHGDGRVESHHFEGEKTGRITKFSARAFSVDWSDSTFTSFWFRSGVSNGFYTESRATFAGGQHVPHWYHKDGTPEFKWRNSNDDDDEVW